MDMFHRYVQQKNPLHLQFSVRLLDFLAQKGHLSLGKSFSRSVRETQPSRVSDVRGGGFIFTWEDDPIWWTDSLKCAETSSTGLPINTKIPNIWN